MKISASRLPMLAFCALFVSVSLSGCVSTSLEDLGIAPAKPTNEPFPDIGNVPEAATEQMSNEEADRLTQDLQDARQSSQAGASRVGIANASAKQRELERAGRAAQSGAPKVPPKLVRENFIY